MNLKNIKIKNFRNLKKINITFQNLINYIYSPNGTGKTNLLEAIQCISIGKSLRADSEIDVINFTNNKPTFIKAEFAEDGLEFSHTYFLENSPKRKKELFINKTNSNINELLGRVPSVWFSPESIKVINTSPKNKRKYFDDILIQLNPEYHFNLKNYNRVLKQRNKLLQESSILNSSQIRIWTEQLIKYGAKIIEARSKFYELINQKFDQLTELKRYKFRISPTPSIKLNEIFDEDIEFTFREALRKSFSLDKLRQSTSVGPHRDDWEMLINIKDNKNKEREFIRADKFASRGQQRMALIILQMVIVKIFEEMKSVKPILLLDDIFSELDAENERILIKFILENNIQSFITGVEEREGNFAQINLNELIKAKND